MLGGLAGQGPGAGGGYTANYFVTPLYRPYTNGNNYYRVDNEFVYTDRTTSWIKTKYKFSKLTCSPISNVFFLGISGGELWTQGRNINGELGRPVTVGDETLFFFFDKVGNSTNWTHTSASCIENFRGTRYYSHGICGGQLWGWGKNDSSLGDGTTLDRTSPVRIGSGSGWTFIPKNMGSESAGGLSGGELWMWGANGNGTVGDGTTTRRSSPVRIGNSSNWTDLSFGILHAIGVCGGQLWGWGVNNAGQLGDGTTTNRTSPVRIGNSSNWSKVWAGYYTSYGLCGGQLWAWGTDTGLHGQGQNYSQTGYKSSPVLISGCDGVSDVSPQSYYSSEYRVRAITGGNMIWWGKDPSGTSACSFYAIDGSVSPPLNLPKTVNYDGNWSSLCVNGNHFGLKNDGTMWWLGYITSNYGFYSTMGVQDQIDPDILWSRDYTIQGYTLSVPTSYNSIPFDVLSQFSGIKNGNLYTWGIKGYENIVGVTYADPSGHGITLYHILSPKQIGTSKNWTHTVSDAAMGHGICGGELWSWGWNSLGGLDNFYTFSRYHFYGDGTTADKFGLVKIGNHNNWTDVSLAPPTSAFRSVVGISGGQLWGWGYDWILNDPPTQTGVYSPIRIGTGNAWKRIFNYGTLMFGISGDDSLWSWGADSNYGLCGLGTVNGLHPTPTQVIHGGGVGAGGQTGWTYVYTDLMSTYGIKDGKLFVWGSNANGQLLNSVPKSTRDVDQIPSPKPVYTGVSGLTGIESIPLYRDYDTYYGYYYFDYGGNYYRLDSQRSLPLGLSGGEIWGWGGITLPPAENPDYFAQVSYNTNYDATTSGLYKYSNYGSNYKSIRRSTSIYSSAVLYGLKGVTV